MRPLTKGVSSVAIHEAGHAVFAWYKGVKLKKVTIVRDRDSAGHVAHNKIVRGRTPELDGSARNRLRMETQIMVCLAGPLAQRIWNPRSCRNYQCRSDHQNAADVALHICGSGKRATAFLRYLRVCVDEFLRAPHVWQKVEALATELERKRTMSGLEVDGFLLKPNP
jgi:Peptidase family M41